MIQVFPSNFSWVLSIIYASTNINKRYLLWDSLKTLSKTHRNPQLVAVDFNKLLNQEKKMVGTTLEEFVICVSDLVLIFVTLQTQVLKVVATPGQILEKKKNRLILEHLDRCFVTTSWIDMYPSAYVTHLPKTYFDHNPLLIRLSNHFNYQREKSFRLE